MKTILQLCWTRFDNTENHIAAAIKTEVLASFMDDENGTAIEKIEKYLLEMGSRQFYIGWDRQIYPKFSLKEVTVK